MRQVGVLGQDPPEFCALLTFLATRPRRLGKNRIYNVDRGRDGRNRASNDLFIASNLPTMLKYLPFAEARRFGFLEMG